MTALVDADARSIIDTLRADVDGLRETVRKREQEHLEASAPVDFGTLWVLRCAYCRKQVVTGDDAVCHECGRHVEPGREAERKALRKKYAP